MGCLALIPASGVRWLPVSANWISLGEEAGTSRQFPCQCIFQPRYRMAASCTTPAVLEKFAAT